MAAQDVTDEFNELCSLLANGEMVRAPEFQLSKAISAVEFFSPKMDAGLITRRPQPEQVTLRYKDLTMDELMAISDRLWMMEMAFLDGTMLAQSVFTCLYAHAHHIAKLKEENFILFAIVVGTLRSCTNAAKLISQAYVCFEEDFHGGSLGIEHFGDSVTDDQVAGWLIEAAGMTESETIRSRLLFRSFFLDASLAMDKFQFSQAEACLLQASNELARCRLGLSTADVSFAFDEEINLWRLAPQPPRPFVTFDSKILLERMYAMIDGLFFVCGARHSVGQGNARGELVNLFEEMSSFSRMKRNMNALVRSRMPLALCDTEQRAFGVAPWKTLVSKDVSIFGPEATTTFLDEDTTGVQACHHFFEVFRVMCFNPARQRRKLVHKIEEWGAFQQRCEMLDAKQMGWSDFGTWDLRKKQKEREDFAMPLGSWSCLWCVRFMERFLELGSELSLYRPREAKSLVYYFFMLYRLEGSMMEASLKKRSLKAEPETSLKHPFSFVLSRRMEMIDMRRMLCMANVQAQMALCHWEKSKEKDAMVVFDSPKMHFEHRFFDPFSTVWLPVILTNNDIENAYSHDVLKSRPIGQIVDICTDTLSKIKIAGQSLLKRLEQQPSPASSSTQAKEKGKSPPPRGVEEDVRSIVKSSIRNSLAIMKLKEAIKGNKVVSYSAVFDANGDASLVTFEVQIEPS